MRPPMLGARGRSSEAVAGAASPGASTIACTGAIGAAAAIAAAVAASSGAPRPVSVAHTGRLDDVLRWILRRQNGRKWRGRLNWAGTHFGLCFPLRSRSPDAHSIPHASISDHHSIPRRFPPLGAPDSLPQTLLSKQAATARSWCPNSTYNRAPSIPAPQTWTIAPVLILSASCSLCARPARPACAATQLTATAAATACASGRSGLACGQQQVDGGGWAPAALLQRRRAPSSSRARTRCQAHHPRPLAQPRSAFQQQMQAVSRCVAPCGMGSEERCRAVHCPQQRLLDLGLACWLRAICRL